MDDPEDKARLKDDPRHNTTKLKDDPREKTRFTILETILGLKTILGTILSSKTITGTRLVERRSQGPG